MSLIFSNISSSGSITTSNPVGVFDRLVYNSNLYANFLQLQGGSMTGALNTNSNLNFD